MLMLGRAWGGGGGDQEVMRSGGHSPPPLENVTFLLFSIQYLYEARVFSFFN